MKRLPLLIALMLALLSLVAPLAAQVVGCAPPPCPMDADCTFVPPTSCIEVRPGVFTNPDWLKIDHHRVNVEITDQIARTTVDMEFVNEGNGLAEGTFLFPIPMGAAVEELIMYINDVPIEARILEADEARNIYDEIVRQYRDPALLEYVGSQLVQANVFPIPPAESRRITITYSQVLEVDNGLFKYNYPLDVSALTSRRPIEEMSVRVSVEGQDAISNIYSPSHDVAINRQTSNTGFVAGFERNNFTADQDFTLYYGLENDRISMNALSYRESANEDGFFMMLLQPPLELEAEQIVPRDIIIVLDQSGSMWGDKWDQARAATSYILENLNEADRFNVILFSTGWRLFSDDLVNPNNAQDAIDWVNNQSAEGGTDINGALTTALEMVDDERPATILFLTDGLATEGVTRLESILDNIAAVARPNARIFTFGVGDDVDTFLLDTLVQEYRGAGSYVRPSERVDEAVASLYNKISSPMLTDVEVTIDGVTVDSLYPTGQLPDLFAGSQLTLVGRYRNGSNNVTVRLSGVVNGETQTYVYEGLNFRENSGGDSFVARLWATRRIGDLLNSIRLHGESSELVQSVIDLSIRYGIITPYTSFLIEEDDILSQTARNRAEEALTENEAFGGIASGSVAVDAADAVQSLRSANSAAPMVMPSSAPLEEGAQFEPVQNPIQTVGAKTFILQGEVWTDTTYQPDTMTTQQVEFLSDAYFDLLDTIPELREYFAVGERVIVLWDGIAYEITVAEAE